MKVLKALAITSIVFTFGAGFYLKYRIDDSKIVKLLSTETKIEQESGFKHTRILYVHRDGVLESKSVVDEFEQPLAKIAARNGCIKMKLSFSDWLPWDKYRGLHSFEEVKCPF